MELVFAWEQVNGLGVGGNYVYCLFIVVIFMGLGGAKRLGCLNSSYGGKPQSQRKGGSFYGEVDPQVFYQNYLPISASFDLKRVLWYALDNIPSC